MPRATKDEKLLETETPQEQVDRMGNGWALQAQYDKQLELPVHLARPDPHLIHRDRENDEVMGYETACGLALTQVTLRSTDDPEDVTCQACLAA